MHVEVVETTTCARSRCDCVIFRLGKPGRLLNKLKSYNIIDKLIAWIQTSSVIENKADVLTVNFLLGLMYSVVFQKEYFRSIIISNIFNDLPDLCALQDVNTKIYLYANDAYHRVSRGSLFDDQNNDP